MATTLALKKPIFSRGGTVGGSVFRPKPVTPVKPAAPTAMDMINQAIAKQKSMSLQPMAATTRAPVATPSVPVGSIPSSKSDAAGGGVFRPNQASAWTGGAGAANSNAIIAPERTTMKDVYSDLTNSGIIPNYTAANYTPVTAQTIKTREVGGINNTLGDDYFKLIEDQASRKLDQKYFGANDSLQKRLQNQMNKRGLIGSGIEVGGTNDLYKGFGDELVDLQSNIAQQKAQTAKELAFRNKDIELSNANAFNEAAGQNASMQNQVGLENAARSLDASQKNRDFRAQLAELGLRSAADEAKTASDYDTGMFEQQVNLRNNDQGFTSDLMNQVNTALQNELISPEDREEFLKLFGSNMSGAFGGSGEAFGGSGVIGNLGSGSSGAAGASSPTSYAPSQAAPGYPAGSYASNVLGGSNSAGNTQPIPKPVPSSQSNTTIKNPLLSSLQSVPNGSRPNVIKAKIAEIDAQLKRWTRDDNRQQNNTKLKKAREVLVNQLLGIG